MWVVVEVAKGKAAVTGYTDTKVWEALPVVASAGCTSGVDMKAGKIECH